MNAITDYLYRQTVLDDQARKIQMRTAWEAYFGKLPNPFKQKIGSPNDSINANFCRLVVDVGASFLFGHGQVGFELNMTEKTEQEEYLEAVWTNNHKMTLLQKAAINGGVTGHVFIKIIEQKGSYPRLVLLDTETVSVVTSFDDVDNVEAYYISYPSRDERGPVLFRETIRKEGNIWIVQDELSTDGRIWSKGDPVVWPYSFPPVIHCQNLPAPNEFWGIADLEPDIIDLQKAINFLLSNINSIIRFHAHPKTWGKGFTAKDLRIGIDETIVFPSPDAELHNLEMQSDLAGSIGFYQRLKEVFHEVSRIPEIASGRLENMGNLSGVALQILYSPLIDKTEAKRRTYGDMLVELNRRILAIGGYGDGLYTKIIWPELLPSDMLQVRQASLIDMQLGASQDTLLQKLGYDPDLERQKNEISSEQLGNALLTAFDHGK